MAHGFRRNRIHRGFMDGRHRHGLRGKAVVFHLSGGRSQKSLQPEEGQAEESLQSLRRQGQAGQPLQPLQSKAGVSEPGQPLQSLQSKAGVSEPGQSVQPV